jgi:hypothetical protein
MLLSMKPSMRCRFHYMALADDRQRIMPMPDDRLPPRGQPLAYPEAVLLVDPINPDLRGEVRWPDRDKDDTCWLSMVSI